MTYWVLKLNENVPGQLLCPGVVMVYATTTRPVAGVGSLLVRVSCASLPSKVTGSGRGPNPGPVTDVTVRV